MTRQSSEASSSAPPSLAGQSGNGLQPECQPRNHRLPPTICVFLALAVWAVFGQTLHYGFVNFDDNRCVYDNAAITHGLNRNSVPWVFTHTLNDNWLPLTALSHMLDCQLYGLNPRGHHLTNVLIHATTVILLFLMLRVLTGTLWRSAFVAAVFAIHPLHVESVAWVSERKDVLSGLFFVLTLWVYLSHARRCETREKTHSSFLRSPFYWLALLLFALGLMSKPMLVTLPFLLLLLDYWPLNRFPSRADTPRPAPKEWLRLVWEKIPFLALSVASCVATVLAQRNAAVSVQGLALSSRIDNAVVSYAIYLRQMFYPAGLAAFYPHPENQLSIPTIALSTLVLLAISACVLAGRRNHPYFLTGWFWYVGMLVPVIGLMQVGGQSRADRYTYLPQIGLCLLLTWGAVELGNGWRWRRVALGATAVAVLTALLADAQIQATYWKDSVSLWTRALETGHESTFALDNLGNALAAQGKVPQAIDQYDRALQLKSDYPEAHNNLGIALARQGNFGEAVSHYERALQLKPDYPEAFFNLGNVLAASGELPQAVQSYERALQLQPDYPEALYNAGNVLADQGKLAEAVQHYEQLLQLKPDDAIAQNNIGTAWSKLGNLHEAIRHLERALQLNPDYFEAHNNLANALFRQGKSAEALQHYERAIQLQPDSIETLYNLANTLADQGKLPAAILRLKQALDLATAQNKTALAEIIRKRLKSFQSTMSQPQIK